MNDPRAEEIQKTGRLLSKQVWTYVLFCGGALLLLGGLICCFVFQWPYYVRYGIAGVAVLLFLCCKQTDKRMQHQRELIETQIKQWTLERTGLFREIWERYEMHRFAGWFDEQTTVDYLADQCNAIDLTVFRNGCEVSFNFDEESIYMTANEGTGQNVSKTVPMTDLADLSAVKELVRTFIAENT